MTSFTLDHDAWGRLVYVDHAGRRHVDVEPIRCFPMTDANRWIAIVDNTGRELTLVHDIAALESVLRSTLETELAKREFVPEIERIESITGRFDPTRWTVITDRGRTTFELKSEDDVRRMGLHSILIIDMHGVRYLIRNLDALDSHGRRLLERFL